VVKGKERYRYSACGENRHDIQILPYPDLTRSRINDQLHVIPDSDPGSRLSRDTFSLALAAVYFLLWQKKTKTMGRNNHSHRFFVPATLQGRQGLPPGSIAKYESERIDVASCWQ
jgi:hypothetical protein